MGGNSTVHVWITRPQADAKQMAELVLTQGMIPWVLPVLAIVPYPAEASAQHHLDQADYILVTSRHAIIAGIEQQGLRLPIHAQWFAVGKATANALLPFQIQAILPEQQDTEGLLSLAELSDIQGKRIVILKGIGGRPVLVQQLLQRGAVITELSLYQRQCTSPEQVQLDRYLQAEGKHIIALASGETLDCLMRELSDKQIQYIISNTKLAVMSERVAQLALSHGWRRDQVSIASTSSLEGLMQAIVEKAREFS
jgi:uroporphyrinogen-III synthase